MSAFSGGATEEPSWVRYMLIGFLILLILELIIWGLYS